MGHGEHVWDERSRRVVLGLGSNLGERAANITAAVRGLTAHWHLALLAVAPFYETPPLGGPPQSDYLNSAALFETRLSPREVLSLGLEVERSLGRLRPDPVRWGPRSIDVDLLWMEEIVSAEADLVVPHPGLRERPFALRPLLDVMPEARDPRTGERYADLPAALAPLTKWRAAAIAAGHV